MGSQNDYLNINLKKKKTKQLETAKKVQNIQKILKLLKKFKEKSKKSPSQCSPSTLTKFDNIRTLNPSLKLMIEARILEENLSTY